MSTNTVIAIVIALILVSLLATHIVFSLPFAAAAERGPILSAVVAGEQACFVVPPTRLDQLPLLVQVVPLDTDTDIVQTRAELTADICTTFDVQQGPDRVYVPVVVAR